MKILDFGLWGLAAFFFGVDACAREASLLSFDDAESSAFATPGPWPDVNAALRTRWTELGSPERLKLSETSIHFHNQRRPARTLAPASNEAGEAALRYPCRSLQYWPTWWLRPEIEVRRAAHFSTMAAVACEFSIPVDLLDAVISQESGYKPWAVSDAGAMGMMQLMPGTAATLGLTTPWDPYKNMRAGARYLRQQLDRFGRVDLALAAYNAGPERQSLALGRVPAIPETMNYVRTITNNWVRLTQLQNTNPDALVRVAAATKAVRASGYREVSLTIYDGANSANPI